MKETDSINRVHDILADIVARRDKHHELEGERKGISERLDDMGKRMTVNTGLKLCIIMIALALVAFIISLIRTINLFVS